MSTSNTFGGRIEIRLAGSGGQGILLAGLVLAEAAAIYDGKNAVQTQSYGPESRGGASRSEIVISDAEIDYPKVTRPDFVLLMTPEAASAYGTDVKPEGIVLVDSPRVSCQNCPARVVEIPITRLAVEVTGRPLTANIVAVGAIATLTKVASTEAVEKAVLSRVPRGTEELNLRALRAGIEAAHGVA
ncbi:MAG: 2-oxoacid:acceptor oxidoreductase family protein [Armatimonadota bacterium]